MNELRRCSRCDFRFDPAEPHTVDQYGYVCQRCLTEEDL